MLEEAVLIVMKSRSIVSRSFLAAASTILSHHHPFARSLLQQPTTTRTFSSLRSSIRPRHHLLLLTRRQPITTSSQGVVVTRMSSSSSSCEPEVIDVDCNLWHRDLNTLKSQQRDMEEDEEEVDPWNILREDAITDANIVAMLSPSSTIEEAKSGLELLQTNPPPLRVKTTVGVHPYHVNDDELEGKSLEEHGKTIKDLLSANSEYCSAVGECGLDTSEGFPPIEDQLPWFRLQVQIAQELQLPIFVHERLAFAECLDILKDVDDIPVIIHCFTGTKEECVEYVKRGYYISVSGYFLKETNDNCNDVLSCLTEGIIPLDKLMIETDAPYMVS